MAAGVHRSRTKTDQRAWNKWTTYCNWLGVHPNLSGISDPVPILQIFAERVRSGLLAAGGQRVGKRSVEQYLRSVAQIFAGVGAHDPRVDTVGKIDFRIKRQLAAYQKEDPAPARVRPIPLPLLHHVAACMRGGNATQVALADMAYIAFFFLLRPGEYCDGGKETESRPFRLRDVTFFIGPRRFSALRVTDAQIRCADYVSLAFTNQKNGIKGESLGHGRSGHSTACPIRCIGDRVLHLRSNGASGHTPLCAVHDRTGWHNTKSAAITSALRASASLVGDAIGIRASDISAKALRAGGAMTLFLGRWTATPSKCWDGGTATPCSGTYTSRPVLSCSSTRP